MDLEKFRQYANSKIKTDNMRKEIKDTLDEYKTTQRAGYEAAKTQFKPLLEAQAAQTKAQEAQAAAQTAAMKQIIPFKKPEEFSKNEQEFIKKYGFPLPSDLISEGIMAYRFGQEDNWKDHMLNISLEVTKLIELTEDPSLKKAAGEYKKSLRKVVTTIVTPQKQQKQPPGYLTPNEALSPAESIESLVEINPRKEAAEKVFDFPLEILTTQYLIDQHHKPPSYFYLEGEDAETAGQDEYIKWRVNFNRFLRDREMEKEAATGNEEYALNNYITQLQKVKEKLPAIPTAESDLNFEFTEQELQTLKKYNIKTPQTVYNTGITEKIKSSEAYKTWGDDVKAEIAALKKNNSKPNTKHKGLKKKYYLKLEQVFKNVQDTKIVSGKGRNRGKFTMVRNQKKFTMGSGIFTKPQELFRRLELLTGAILAGNSSKKIRNDAYNIIDKLLEIGLITKTIYNKYIKEYLKH